MARFLTTIPSNLGFYNLGTVEAYPTGGTGPTAYGPTSYFGSDPLPATAGDSLYNPIDLGEFSAVFKSLTLTNSHGGLSRRQTTFYKLRLTRPRSIQFFQQYSTTALTSNTNKNTLLAFYQITEDKRREELPLNNNGYVYSSSAIDAEEQETRVRDYPAVRLNPGEYLFLITNDIKYLETTYSIGINIATTDWRFVNESVDEALQFGLVTNTADSVIDFGAVVD
jgi:hypothetical protein